LIRTDYCKTPALQGFCQSDSGLKAGASFESVQTLRLRTIVRVLGYASEIAIANCACALSILQDSIATTEPRIRLAFALPGAIIGTGIAVLSRFAKSVIVTIGDLAGCVIEAIGIGAIHQRVTVIVCIVVATQ